MEHDPYAPPAEFAAPPLSPMEMMRRDHIGHESSVKLIGLLCGVLGILVVGLSMASFGSHLSRDTSGLPRDFLGGGIGGALLLVAFGLNSLQKWARIACAVLAAVGLLGFPVGTIISGYVYYLLFSPKGTVVFSPDYQAVIAATPQVRHQTAKVAWFVLVGLLVFLVVVWAAVSR